MKLRLSKDCGSRLQCSSKSLGATAFFRFFLSFSPFLSSSLSRLLTKLSYRFVSLFSFLLFFHSLSLPLFSSRVSSVFSTLPLHVSLQGASLTFSSAVCPSPRTPHATITRGVKIVRVHGGVAREPGDRTRLMDTSETRWTRPGNSKYAIHGESRGSTIR